MGGLFDLIFFLVVFVGAFFIGTAVEKAHYESINRKEAEGLNFPVVTTDNIDENDDIEAVQLVVGSVVISLDYFKRFLAGLRNIFGGRIISYETLLDRGRREAVIRMREKAQKGGFNMVLNMRFETSSIAQVTAQKGSMGSFEVIAYGTAIRMKVK